MKINNLFLITALYTPLSFALSNNSTTSDFIKINGIETEKINLDGKDGENTLNFTNGFYNLINMSGNKTNLSINKYKLNVINNGGGDGSPEFSSTVGIYLQKGSNINLNNTDFDYTLNNKYNYMQPYEYRDAFLLEDNSSLVADNLKLNVKKGDGLNVTPNAFYLKNNSSIKIKNSTLNSEYNLIDSINSTSKLSNSTINTINGIYMKNSIVSISDNTSFNFKTSAFIFMDGTNELNIQDSVINSTNKNNSSVFFVNGNNSRQDNTINIYRSKNNINSQYLIFSTANKDEIKSTFNTNDSELKGIIYSTSNIKNKLSYLDLNFKNSSFLGNIVSAGNSEINVNLNGSSWTGSTYLVDTSNIKESSILNVNINSGTWNMTKNSNVTNLTLDNSTLVFTNNDVDSSFKTLTINGDYIGNNAHIEMSGKLGNNSSPVDRIYIKGNSSGETNISVKNIGGNGDLTTLNGIELITVDGNSKGNFSQDGRIIAGAYDYYLHRGENGNSNNWYLKSELSESNPKPEPEPIIRPEVGSYISNLQAAGTIFNTTLKDRQGGGTYINPVTGEVYTSSLWMRSIGGHQKAKINSQSDYTANKFVYQMGGDIINGSLQDNNEYHLGIMAGYGNQHNKSHNKLSGYKSKGALWGYSTGLYGTWYQNGKTNTGLYVDSWLLYNWFNNSVSGDELAYENYKSKGFTASIESGYAFNIASFPSFGDTVNNVYLTPQAQAIWSGVKADKHKESNGTEVKGLGNNNIQTRVGLRLSMANEGSPLKDLPIRPLMPFIEANWLYTSKQYGVSMNNENTYIQGSRNVGEVKAGLEADLNHNITLWGNVAQQFGSHSYQNTQGMLGVKYAF